MIICDTVLNARQFAEYYSNKYFTNCDTFEEVRKCLASECIYIGSGYNLKNIRKMEPSKCYVIVEFSTEENYTEHEYRFMLVQKKYQNRFTRNMKEAGVA